MQEQGDAHGGIIIIMLRELGLHGYGSLIVWL